MSVAEVSEVVREKKKYANGDPSAWDFPLARASHGELAVGPSNLTFFEFSW